MRTEATIITNESASILALKKQLGKLITVLDLIGIPILEEKHEKRLKCFLLMVTKLCYPCLLHFSTIFLWRGTILRGETDYAAIIDMVVPLLATIMWWMIYTRRLSLKTFLIHLAKTMSANLVSKTRYLAFTVNVSLCLIFVYPFLLIKVKLLQHSENTVSMVEGFRYVHEIIFPAVVSVMYTAICYILLENLRIFEFRFQKELNFSSIVAITALKKKYMAVIKGVEMFEDLFSAPALFLVMKIFCTVSIAVMDMMYIPGWISKLSLEVFFYCAFIFVSLGILTVYAGNIPLEMSRIKAILLDITSEQSGPDGLFCGEKQIQCIIQRDVTVLTGWNIFSFDRGFLLKSLITVIAQAVLIYQLGVTVISSRGSSNTCSTNSTS
ncbi:uncharacterized protein TNCV_4838971 [Trichonephila clavipes]|nr:uncharacterized protein TNCV_4838971 [Trichonephila clavipes]